MILAGRGAVVLAVVALAAPARGGPILGPAFLYTSSPHERAVLVSDPDTLKSRVLVAGRGSPSQMLWEMRGFEPVGFVSDDGEYVAFGQPGNELINNTDPGQRMISFYHRGALVRVVTLAEVVLEPARLPRVPDEFSWGTYRGFVGPRRFAVETQEKRRIVFDVTTGLAIGAGSQARTGRFTEVAVQLAPSRVRLTMNRSPHAGLPAIAAGPRGYALAWEEQDPAHPSVHRVSMATVDRSGRVLVAAHRILEAGGSPPDLRLIWNGRTFTLVTCGAAWPTPGRAAVVWGDLDEEGRFRESGRYAVQGHNGAFGCGEPTTEAGGEIFLPLKVRDTSYDDGKVERGRRCTARPLVLGRSAKPGRDLRLCHVMARTPRGTLGIDENGVTAIVEPGGRHRPTSLTGSLVASAGGDRFVLLADDFGVVLDGRFTVNGSFRLPSTPGEVTTGLRALDNGSLAGYRHVAEGLELSFFDTTGAVRWHGRARLSGEPGDLPKSVECTGSDGLACVYVAGDAGLREDVYFAILRP